MNFNFVVEVELLEVDERVVPGTRPLGHLRHGLSGVDENDVCHLLFREIVFRPKTKVLTKSKSEAMTVGVKFRSLASNSFRIPLA